MVLEIKFVVIRADGDLDALDIIYPADLEDDLVRFFDKDGRGGGKTFGFVSAEMDYTRNYQHYHFALTEKAYTYDLLPFRNFSSICVDYLYHEWGCIALVTGYLGSSIIAQGFFVHPGKSPPIQLIPNKVHLVHN